MFRSLRTSPWTSRCDTFWGWLPKKAARSRTPLQSACYGMHARFHKHVWTSLRWFSSDMVGSRRPLDVTHPSHHQNALRRGPLCSCHFRQRQGERTRQWNDIKLDKKILQWETRQYEVKLFEFWFGMNRCKIHQNSREPVLCRKAQASRDANLLHKEFPKELFK